MTLYWQRGYDHTQCWTGQDWCAASKSGVRIDPYLVWAETRDYVDLGGRPDEWIPLIIALNPEMNVPKFIKDVLGRPDNKGSHRWIQVHPLYHNAPTELDKAKFCTAIVKKKFFSEFVSTARQKQLGVERFELGLPIVAKAGIVGASRRQIKPRSHKKGPPLKYVVGVIDDGFAFAHERFRRNDGSTRVDFFWDQGYHPVRIETPEYGQEHSNADIDEYMRLSQDLGSVDEDAAYRQAGYEAVRRRLAHGTHVMDVACGADPKKPREQSSGIVCVQLQLPSRRTRDRFAGWLAIRVLDGLRFILQRGADTAGSKCPVVANLSFGNIAGPHDGSSILEMAIDDLINQRRANEAPFDVVIASGNSNLSRCHASFELEPRQSQLLEWRVLPDDPTPNFLEIWLPFAAGVNADVEVTIATPWGDESLAITAGDVWVWRPRKEALCTVVYLSPVATGTRNMILVGIAPSASLDASREVAPSGIWSVTTKNRSASRLAINAWIQRDETPFNFPRHGRQSHFDDPSYKRFDELGRIKGDDDKTGTSYIKRRGTINSIATGEHTTTIGGFRRSDGDAVRYSSSGPMLEPVGPGKTKRRGPDASAVTDDSVVLHGILAAGSRSGSVIAMDGTSVAAAQITHLIAHPPPPKPPDPSDPNPPTPGPPSRPRPGRDAIEALAKQQEKGQPLPADMKHPRRPNDRKGPRPKPPLKTKPPQERVGHGRIGLVSTIDRKRESDRE